MEIIARDRLREKFINPPTYARSFPFWAWNGKLDTDEIRNQIRQMHRQGIGGFFMHSREGLETKYMEEEWNACIKAAVDEAKKLGMYAWLYDEDRWPSGTAGGQVTAGGDEYRCKGLTLEVCKVYDTDIWKEENLLAVYVASIHKHDIYALQRIQEIEDVVKLDKLQQGIEYEEIYLIVRLEVSKSSEWFNNEAPPDNLNPNTVKRFIALTHEKYFELCGDEFGKTVPGIFTDEPSLADFHTSFLPNRSWIPWTYEFKDYFLDTHGYDPLDLIPFLYFNGEKSRKIRHDYWYSITLRYSESYSKVLGEWCEEHGIALTGHFLQEDKLGLAARVNGAIMPHYEYQHIPGIDILQEQTDEFLTVKQCTSVAHQMGRPIVISETYGCTGWEFNFEGQRHIGDWQYVLGVNRRCQHLALYSIAGCRKRDYPPCFNYNTSWWEKNHVVEDYFARLSSLLEEGEAIQKVLLLHPASTAWSMLGASPYGNPLRCDERDVPKINEIGNRFNNLIKNLCFHHYDMDLGDEIIMSKHGSIDGKMLRIGEAVYETMVIPPMDTMLLSTYQLLSDYLDAGGNLYVLKPFATMIEGDESKLILELWNRPGCTIVENERELLHQFETSIKRTISITDKFGNEEIHCLALQKKIGDDELLFVVNNDREKGYDVTIDLFGNEMVEELNPLNGEILPVLSREVNGKLSFEVSFGNADSKLFRILSHDTFTESVKITTDERKSIYVDNNIQSTKEILYQLPDKAKYSCTMENTLTLDYCTYQLRGEWSKPMEIWAAQKEIREKLGMGPIHINGIEQRYKWIEKEHPQDGRELKLKLKFEIDVMPVSTIYLALEHPEWFIIYCNGILMNNEPKGYLLDKDIKKVSLSELVIGNNDIELHCLYKNIMELEDCYICGEFGVTRERKIVSMPSEVYVGDWTSQGFYHYAGGINYQYTFEFSKEKNREVYLEFESYFGTCMTVIINDKKIEVPWKAASNLKISEYLLEGSNQLMIELMGSPRNLFGPFHLSERKRGVINDMCFRATDTEYSANYNIVSYGLYQSPRLFID